MSKLPAFKRVELEDRFTPERTATFERPLATNDTVIVKTDGRDFHLDTAQLQTIATLLAKD